MMGESFRRELSAWGQKWDFRLPDGAWVPVRVSYQGDEVGQGDFEGDGDSVLGFLHWPASWVIVVEEVVVKAQLLVLPLTSAWGWGQAAGSGHGEAEEPLCSASGSTGLCFSDCLRGCVFSHVCLPSQ